MEEFKAKIRLTDGQAVWCDAQGPFRDVSSGRFISQEDLEAHLPNAPNPPDAGQHSAAQQARQQLLAAVRAMGFDVETVEQAWGKLVEVQAELALEKEQGSKATTAARFVGQMTGLDESEQENRQTDHLVLWRELALEILRMLEEETGN